MTEPGDPLTIALRARSFWLVPTCRPDRRRATRSGAPRGRPLRVQLRVVEGSDVQGRVESSEHTTDRGHEPARAVPRHEPRVDRRAAQHPGRELADDALTRPAHAAATCGAKARLLLGRHRCRHDLGVRCTGSFALGLGLDRGLGVWCRVGRCLPRERELELALRLLGESQLELRRGVLRGSARARAGRSASARARGFGLGPSSIELLRYDGANGSPCQALNLGLEARDCITQHAIP